jgi:TBC1 domain family protein 5
MGREFPLEQLLPLWDALFAYGQELRLLDYVAVAMLIHIRDQSTSSPHALEPS